MFRDNLIGVLLLAVCTVAGIAIVWQISSGERLSYDGPGWLITALGIVIVVGSLYMVFQGRIRGRDQQWPNPTAGRKPLWRSFMDKLRGKSSN